MGRTTQVYDLGELDTGHRPVRPAGNQPPAVRAVRSVPAAAPARGGGVRSAVAGSLSLALPGAGHFVLSRFAVGLFLLTSLGFVLASCWAILQSLDRLIVNLPLLGLPVAAVMWTLAVVAGAVPLLHVAGVIGSAPGEASVVSRPLVSAVASALIPGWGQLLNGDRMRAAVFLVAMWLVATAWTLASTPFDALCAELGLYLPWPLEFLRSPMCRWALPAVIWTLAIYDAFVSAAGRRR